MKLPIIKIILISSMVLFCSNVFSADWPQYAGPNRNNISTETGILQTWENSQPKVLWTIPLGHGFGGPAIMDNKVYILDRDELDKGEKQGDILKCLNLLTGKEEWSYSYTAPGKYSHEGSRSAPAVDDKYVFSVGPLGNFICIDKATHKLVWEKNLREEFKVGKLIWEFAQNPCFYKDWVIVAPQGEKAGVAAFKKSNGKVIWKTRALNGKAGYSSPVLVTIDGVDQFVMTSASKKKDESTLGEVIGISANDGKILWEYEGWQCEIPIAFPAYIGDGKLFLTGGYKAGSAMIQVKKTGNKFEVKEIFKTQECGSQIHQPILYQDYLYINSNDLKSTVFFNQSQAVFMPPTAIHRSWRGLSNPVIIC